MRLLPLAACLLTLIGSARAAEQCKARLNQKTGAVEVLAAGVDGAAEWSTTPAGPITPFGDPATCRVGDRLRRCHLGAPGTLAEVTPPAGCRVCVRDGAANVCCTFVRGCTPGTRPTDDSFAAGDPRNAVPVPAAVAPASLSPIGIWQRTGGDFLFDSVDVLILDADGSGSAATKGQEGGVTQCQKLNHASATGSELFLARDHSPARLFRVRQASPEVLALTDADGRRVELARVASVPPDFVCGTLTEQVRFDLSVQPSGALAFDGTALWFTIGSATGQSAMSISLDTGIQGTPIPVPGFIHAVEGRDFWTLDPQTPHEARRVARDGTVVDRVSTDDLGIGLRITALARDGVTGDLLLAVKEDAAPVTRILRVGAHQIVSDVRVGVDIIDRIRSLAFDGTTLWAGGAQDILRIDPADGRVLATFVPSDFEPFTLIGIASVGGDLALLGLGENDSAIVRVRP